MVAGDKIVKVHATFRTSDFQPIIGQPPNVAMLYRGSDGILRKIFPTAEESSRFTTEGVVDFTIDGTSNPLVEGKMEMEFIWFSNLPVQNNESASPEKFDFHIRSKV